MPQIASVPSLAKLEALCPSRSLVLSNSGGPQTISYRSAGERHLPCIVLAHGIGSASASWAQQLLGLSDRFHVVAWDAPGYGGSTPLPAERPSAADYGQVLHAFLDALGLQPALWVGHSLGCLMVAGCVAEPSTAGKGASNALRFEAQPHHANAPLLLLSPAQGYANSDAALREQKLADRLHALQTLGPAGMAAKRAHAMLSPGAAAELQAFVAHNMAQIVPAGYTQAAQMLAHSDLAQLLQKRIGQAPSTSVVLACGDADTITPPSGVCALAQRLGLPYHALNSAGHACALEAADAVNALIVQLGCRAGGYIYT